jgi:hypothetical protein
MLAALLAALFLVQHSQVVQNYQDFCQRSAQGTQYAECMLDTPEIREYRQGDWVSDLTYFVGTDTKLHMVYYFDHVPYLMRDIDYDSQF